MVAGLLFGGGMLATEEAGAQVDPGFSPDAWEYGPRNDPDGEVEIWNPVMQKIRSGDPVIGGTIRATDPRTYCAVASAGYDFTWTEMQHEAISWEQVARMWRTCPGSAVPGVRVAHESEGNIQMPTDMGALVIMVPTVDSEEEARRAVDWTYFPPLGRRSAGGGQAWTGDLWGGVPGGYRATWNENVVLILMIETLEGVENAREIARIPGVDGLFAASGDLGNFSGYREGDPEYEMLITEIAQAARAAGKVACGPLRWMGERPDFTCFQASTEGANIRRGAQEEIRAARERYSRSDATSGAGRLVSDLRAACGEIVYEADCLEAVRRAAEAGSRLSSDEVESIRSTLQEIVANNPGSAARIREVARENGLDL
ncbi:MAG: HpcH/HpaI aldolase family protein [Gemmatimonadota bacterium]